MFYLNRIHFKKFKKSKNFYYKLYLCDFNYNLLHIIGSFHFDKKSPFNILNISSKWIDKQLITQKYNILHCLKIKNKFVKFFLILIFWKFFSFFFLNVLNKKKLKTLNFFNFCLFYVSLLTKNNKNKKITTLN